MSAHDTSSDRFRRYEESFLNSSRIVTRSITQLSGSRGKEDAINSISVDIEFEIDDAESYVVAMESEFRSMPSADKKSAQQKVKIHLSEKDFHVSPTHVCICLSQIIQISGYKEEVNQLKEHFKRTKAEADALALKSGSSSRQKLLTNQQKLDNSTATLEKSRMIIAQTDQIGNETINNMENQKEQLVGAAAKVDETRGYTSDAKDVLTAMANRALRHTACVGLVIVILLGLNVITIYFAFIDKNNK